MMETVNDRKQQQLKALRQRCHNQRAQYNRLQQNYNNLHRYRCAETQIHFYKESLNRATIQQQRQKQKVECYRKYVNAIQDALNEICPEKSNEIIARAVRLYNDKSQ